eukprot:SAG22_NODE_1414_length_4475_cov_10.897395_2_plen_147_part_00
MRLRVCVRSRLTTSPVLAAWVGHRPWLAPCDDNETASTGAQPMKLTLDQLPKAWLVGGGQQQRQQQQQQQQRRRRPAAAGGGVGEDEPAEAATAAGLECEFFDIFGGDSPHTGKALGRLSAFAATVPPHGVKFLRLSDCAPTRVGA